MRNMPRAEINNYSYTWVKMKIIDIRSPVFHTYLFLSFLVWVPIFFFVDNSFLLPLALALIVSLLLVFALARIAPGAVLRSLGSIPATEKQFPRLHNALDGICVNHGLDKPDVYVIESPNGNAAAVADKRSQAVVLTTGAIDSLDLVEIEGLLAQLIAKCLDSRLSKKTVEAFFLRFPLVGIFTGSKKYQDDVRLEDVRGAELTRYPPGVQRSLLALKGLGTEIEDAPKSTSHLWLMNPKGLDTEETHPSTEERVSAMEEL